MPALLLGGKIHLEGKMAKPPSGLKLQLLVLQWKRLATANPRGVTNSVLASDGVNRFHKFPDTVDLSSASTASNFVRASIAANASLIIEGCLGRSEFAPPDLLHKVPDLHCEPVV